MKARWFRTFGVLLACATLTLVACGDDSTTDAGAGGAGGAGAGGAGAGGTGGGTGGTTAGKSGGGAGAAGAVSCGGVTCSVNGTLKLLNPAAQACCTPEMKCGQYNRLMKCLPNAAPGPADSSCPTLKLMVTVSGMMTTQSVTGCCTPKGQCGNDFSAIDWGCVARTDLDEAMGGPLMSLACGAGDGGGDAGL